MSGQGDFRKAIFDPQSEIPQGLLNPKGEVAGKRFNVYRNNVATSLTEALEVGFPIVRRIVGDEFFKAMAGVFLRMYPPSSPMLMFYGTEMPDFLGGFEPVKHLGYLRDVARLELARRNAYHAADANPIGPEVMQGADLMSLSFSLAPALQVVRSQWPLYGIWRANTDPDAPKPVAGSEDVLVTRPDYDPVVSLLPLGGAKFIEALAQGDSLGAAILAPGDGCDPGPVLNLLLSGGGITGIKQGDPS